MKCTHLKWLEACMCTSVLIRSFHTKSIHKADIHRGIRFVITDHAISTCEWPSHRNSGRLWTRFYLCRWAPLSHPRNDHVTWSQVHVQALREKRRPPKWEMDQSDCGRTVAAANAASAGKVPLTPTDLTRNISIQVPIQSQQTQRNCTFQT